MFIQGEELKQAAKRGDVIFVERLVNEIPNLINYADSVRMMDAMIYISLFISVSLVVVGRATALHSAACYGHTAVCAFLLDKGADIHAKNQVSDIDRDLY